MFNNFGTNVETPEPLAYVHKKWSKIKIERKRERLSEEKQNIFWLQKKEER
jgi:hypothetical protein